MSYLDRIETEQGQARHSDSQRRYQERVSIYVAELAPKLSATHAELREASLEPVCLSPQLD